MNIAIVPLLPDFVVTAIPAKQPYWQGYDQYLDCFFANDFLSSEEFAAMTPEERRGYEAAQRHQADTETDSYMMRYNTNAYGDYTQGGGF